MSDRPKKTMHAQHSARTKKHQEKFGRSNRADRQNQQAKDALESLFTPTDDPQVKKEWNLLTQLSGQAWQKKALALIDQYGYPAQAEHSVALLDLENADAIKGLFTFVQNQWSDYSASSQQTLQKKAHVTAMMALDDELIDALEKFSTLP